MVVSKSVEDKSGAKDCFVIMPIADSDGYDDGHFRKVYEDIFKPACLSAGLCPVRADEVTQTNLIHLDILQKLIESPIAICDLSSRNPNVLFELGLRQAFDKPTVLVQEVGTPRIFDIAPLRYTEYRKTLRYREVLEDQRSIETALKSTIEAAKTGEGVNSIVKILSLAGPATIPKYDEHDSSALLQLVRAEMSELRSDFRRAVFEIGARRKPEMYEMPRSTMIKRFREAQASVSEVENSIGRDVPLPLVLPKLNRAQEIYASILAESLPGEFREEVQSAYTQSVELEHHLVGQRKTFQFSSNGEQL